MRWRSFQSQRLGLHAAGMRLHVRMTMLDESGVAGEAKEAIALAFQSVNAVLGRLLGVSQGVKTRTSTVVGKIPKGKE